MTDEIKILVAEDEEQLRELLQIVLEDEGYQVDAAKDGQVASELMMKKTYDVLLTDLYMPKVNGIELIQSTKKNFPKTKNILVSGGGKELVAKHGEKSISFNGEIISIDMFLKKPCELDDILEAIKSS